MIVRLGSGPRTVLLSVTMILASVASVAAQSTLVLENVNVLPMVDDEPVMLAAHSVLVVDGVVQAVAPVGELAVPAGARRIDGGGSAYVMPGLVDAHVHLRGRMDDWIGLFPIHGVTTVFNLAGSRVHLEARDRVRTTDWLAPTIYTTGPFVNEPRVTTPEEAEEAVAEHVEAGYDFLKIHGELQADTYERLMSAARAADLTVIGHAPRNLPFDVVIEQAMPMVAHAEELIYTKFQRLTADRADLPGIAAGMAESGVWLTPTLSTFANITHIWGDASKMEPILAQPQGRHLTAGLRAFWTRGNDYSGRDVAVIPRLEQMLSFQETMIPALHEAGVQLLAGTDTPLPGLYPGWSMYVEIETLVAAGLDPYDALLTATRNPGRFIAEHVAANVRFGTVSQGAQADLLLLDANPLEDLGRLKQAVGVVLRGRWLPRAELDAALDGIGESANP